MTANAALRSLMQLLHITLASFRSFHQLAQSYASGTCDSGSLDLMRRGDDEEHDVWKPHGRRRLQARRNQRTMDAPPSALREASSSQSRNPFAVLLVVSGHVPPSA